MPPLRFREHGFCYSHSVERLIKGLPCETLALPTSPIEPFEGTLYRPIVELLERLHVAPYAVVVVVSLQPSVQAFDKLAAFQVTVLLDGCFCPNARIGLFQAGI